MILTPTSHAASAREKADLITPIPVDVAATETVTRELAYRSVWATGGVIDPERSDRDDDDGGEEQGVGEGPSGRRRPSHARNMPEDAFAQLLDPRRLR